jgi:aromatic-ring opening dioxygenase LigAB LigA subunit
MGNVERCDKTLALNEMIFYVRRDARLRERWTTDLEGLAREFGLSDAEYQALRDQDLRRLNDMGVHQYYLPQILRLFYGASANSNSHPALEAYKRAFPEETAQAQSLQAKREGDAIPRSVPAPPGRDERGGLGGPVARPPMSS